MQCPSCQGNPAEEGMRLVTGKVMVDTDQGRNGG